MDKLQSNTTKDELDKGIVASKFLSKVLENSIRQSLFCDLQDKKIKTNISEKKAIKILNTKLIIPIEATLDDTHMLCCLKNFEEQGIMYVMYEDDVDRTVKTILVSENDCEKVLAIVKKHHENQGISQIYKAYGKDATEAINRFYQERFDYINTRDNSVDDVLDDYRDREGINGHICYIVNRTNPENVAEILTIKKYKKNNTYILITDINIYKLEECVKKYSEVDEEYGHAWQAIKERVIDLLDAESGVVIFNTMQEVVRYKELFYEQLYLRDDLQDTIISPDLSELGNSQIYDEIIDDLEIQLQIKDCLFVEEKDNIKDQIENYQYIQALMKEYEEYIVEYMDKSVCSTDIDEDDEEWEHNMNEELDEKKKELEEYLLKSRLLQVERLCIVRNCIGKLSAQLIAENIDRNIACRYENEIDIEDVSEPSKIDNKTTFGGLDSKLVHARSNYESYKVS